MLMLQERVLAFVEGALVRSTPGRVFTAGVLASVAAISPPAKAAAAGTVTTHAAAAAKSAGIAAMLASISGVVSTVLTLRANLDQARTSDRPTEGARPHCESRRRICCRGNRTTRERPSLVGKPRRLCGRVSGRRVDVYCQLADRGEANASRTSRLAVVGAAT